jgi:excisionase family DNA binding protein
LEQLLNVKEVAAYLKCTEQTVRRYVMAKKIPFRKIDRMVRFWPSEIKEWVDKTSKSENVKRNDMSGDAGLFGETENGGDNI